MRYLTPTVVYLLCFLASGGCALLLGRAYVRTKTRLLFWTFVSFILLALNNGFLVADLVLFPETDLWWIRQMTAVLSIGALLYGFIWEAEH